MRRVFTTRQFSRRMRKTELTESALCMAVVEMVSGLIDAALGGGVFKKRVATPGRGKSASARTLMAANRAGRWFFVFEFEKNERSNDTGVKSKRCSDWLQTFCGSALANSTSMSAAMH
jgi:hypothetical protein